MKDKILIFVTVSVIVLSLIVFIRGLYSSIVEEWISPEGVHYWMTDSGISPRLNADGELVVE